MRVPPGSQLVFDQVLTDVIPNGFSDPKFNDWLGLPNDLSLFVVVDRVSGAIDLQSFGAGIYVLEASDDDLGSSQWFPSLPGAAANVQSALPAGQTTVLVGADTEVMRSLRPSLGFRRLYAVVSTDGTASARIRMWVAGRNGYRRFNRLLIAERVEGTTPIYASHEACAWLAGVDRLCAGILTEEVSGTAPVTLDPQSWESPNGRVWSPIVTAPYTITSGTFKAQAMAVDLGPQAGFVRFGVQLGGTNPAATVRMWLTGRDVRAG